MSLLKKSYKTLLRLAYLMTTILTLFYASLTYYVCSWVLGSMTYGLLASAVLFALTFGILYSERKEMREQGLPTTRFYEALSTGLTGWWLIVWLLSLELHPDLLVLLTGWLPLLMVTFLTFIPCAFFILLCWGLANPPHTSLSPR